jgi:SAM-dependent methyltransferase
VDRLVREYVSPSSAVLDMGCGNGRAGGPLVLSCGGRYVGVDVSHTAVAAAREIGLDARVIEDASALPFAAETFDFVLSIEVFEHLFRPDLAVAEIARVLRPGGTAVITVPNVAYWRHRVDLAMFGRWNPYGDDQSVQAPWRDPHIRFFNRTSLARMLDQSGFDSVAVRGHGGALLRDLPGLRRLGSGNVSRGYLALERVVPALFASRLHAVASHGAVKH